MILTEFKGQVPLEIDRKIEWVTFRIGKWSKDKPKDKPKSKSPVASRSKTNRHSQHQIDAWCHNTGGIGTVPLIGDVFEHGVHLKGG